MSSKLRMKFIILVAVMNIQNSRVRSLTAKNHRYFISEKKNFSRLAMESEGDLVI